jgi:hypothetical protein
MSERNGFEMQMSPGAQPPSGLGDRVLVGLATLVLLAGALIAVGNVLPDPDEIGQASAQPSSRPSRTPRPLPTPAPPRIATVEAADVEITAPPQTYAFSGWVRALEDVVVYSSPDLGGGESGVLKAGEFTYADQADQAPEDPGWLSIQAPLGWIASREGGVERVRRYEYPQARYSGWVGDLAAGPHGFVSLVMPPSDPDHYPPSLVASSVDGSRWQSNEAPFVGPWYGGSVAWGPAGWLAAVGVSDEIHQRVLLWSSSDGQRWSELGMLGGVEREYVARFIGSADGYLLETYPDGRGGSGGPSIWSSSDGLTWRESTSPVLQRPTGDRRLVALQHGYYLSDVGDGPGTSLGAFSPDGLSWSEIESVPDGIDLQLTELDGRLVAVDLDRVTLQVRVWSADREGGTVSWLRESASDAAFAGGVVSALVADGTRAYAFGWDLVTEEPLVWTGDGVHWLRSPLPAAFGGLPARAAAGPTGVVVIGFRHTLRGDNPIFWWRTAVGGWAPEADPLLEAVPDPSGDECPALPGDVLEYTVVDAAAVVACHGDVPISFRAYSTPCPDCWGTMEGDPRPAWLLNPSGDQLFLSPQPDGGWTGTAVLSPSIAGPHPEWRGAWIEVTGHFDDEAAATCHRDPTPDEVSFWAGQVASIEQCRLTFVVTAVTPVDGP